MMVPSSRAASPVDMSRRGRSLRLFGIVVAKQPQALYGDLAGAGGKDPILIARGAFDDRAGGVGAVRDEADLEAGGAQAGEIARGEEMSFDDGHGGAWVGGADKSERWLVHEASMSDGPIRAKRIQSDTVDDHWVPGWQVIMRYYWLMLAEGHLTRTRFAAMMRRIALLPLPAN